MSSKGILPTRRVPDVHSTSGSRRVGTSVIRRSLSTVGTVQLMPRLCACLWVTLMYTSGDSDVISSCQLFSAILWGKLCEMFVILTSVDVT